MDEIEPVEPSATPPEGHHRSARERQRRGPMWGCLRALFFVSAGAFLLILLIVGGGWWYLGSASFNDLVRLRIEKTLEARLERDVTIGQVEFDRSRPQRVILRDLRIANSPGAVNRDFATVREVVITGGVESFWGRTIRVGRVDIIDPAMNFEVYPEGAALVHNFPHWKSGPPSRYEILHIEIGTLNVTGGRFVFLDRKHQITAEAIRIASGVNVTRAKNLYEGVMTSPRLRVTIKDYEPFDVDLRGGFRFTPGVVALNSIAMKGRGMQLFLSGRLDPLSEAVYDLRLRSQLELARVREVFRVEKTLEGTLSLDTRLQGKAGDFTLAGGWAAPAIAADTYELADARGRLSVNGDKTLVDIERAVYGGGSVNGHYELTRYAEPYPMTLALGYDRISIEQLFSDWDIENTGLRGAATGKLDYHWNKDKVLEGAGTGTARLSKSSVAFSKARYPIGLAGSTDFALDRGVVTFRRAELDTDQSHVSLTGSLRIEGAVTDLRMRIDSRDFSELDKAGFNFARSAGKNDYELLGLGGAGEITGTVQGPIEAPQVSAHITGSGTKYNNVQLGAADIDLRYDGPRNLLTFERATFNDAGGRLSLAGTVIFPDRGPSPLFDIGVEAENYPVDHAVQAVNLDFKVGGTGTGKLTVSGSPENGTVRFADLIIHRGESQLRLAGSVAWLPGEGNVLFDLDIAARSFPIGDIIAFLDLGELPVSGELTGTLHIEGPKSALQGAGAVIVRNGAISGEPIDVASADIVFTEGRMRATNVSITAPAGQITGEADFNLATEQFSYTINSSSIDLSRIKLLESLKGILGGSVTLTSSGAGTADRPELVVEATLNDATLQGLSLPPGSAPPSIYLAIRNGKLIVRGSIADVVDIEGNGTIGAELAVDGTVRITIADISRLLSISPATATLPAAGSAVIELQLGGKLSSLEALRIDGTVPQLDLSVSGHQFTAPEPLRFALRDGRVELQSFQLQRNDSSFAITGFAEITGEKRLALDVRGNLEAALLQLFVPDMEADGQVALEITVSGTLPTPFVTGTAEFQGAQVKFAGFPQLISDISGTLVFHGDQIEIDSLRATVGGGTVVAGGSIVLNGFMPEHASITLQGAGVSIRYFEGVTVEGDFSMRLSGGLDRMTLQGEVDVTRALYFRDFDLRQSILNVILSRRGITPVVAASWQDHVSLDIILDAPDTLAVRNNIAEVTGSAKLELTGTLANPVVIGDITLNEGGTVTFQNTDYRLVRGTIDFQNPFRIDPYFDVTLEGRVTGNAISEVESGPIELTVNITGTLDRISPTITSDPPASDITLFSILGFGNLTRNTPGGSGGPNAALVGQSLLYQSLFSAIGQRILPFADSFTYDPGLLETSSAAAGRRVTFEKRMSNDIRLLVVYNLDRNESAEVVEWAVNRDWTLQFTYDTIAGEYRVDARFRRRYDGRWSGGAARRAAEIFPLGRVTTQMAEQLSAPPPTTRVRPPAGSAVVTEVQYRTDGPFDVTPLGEYVSVKPGTPLTIRDVQSSVKALFATGNFRDVRVDVTSAEAPVVTFVLSLDYRVETITFEGVDAGGRTRAERALTTRSGDVLSLSAVDRSAVAIADGLRREGYLEATVDPETTFVRENNLANVIFHVIEGPQAKVGTIAIDGQLAPFSYAELLGRMREKPGGDFRLATARSDADRIRTFLLEKDYRRADVDFVDHTYDTVSKTVALRYSVNAGPKVKVEVEGVPRSTVRRLLPFRGNQEYSEDAIDRAADEIIRSYQGRGYFNVAVDTETRNENGIWLTIFHVNPGLRYTLRDVTFSGNTKLADKQLEEIAATTARGGFRRLLSSILRRPTGVTRQQLSDDRDALESHYRLQGFSEATVGAPVATGRPDGSMVVDFPITEGPQTLVSTVKVEGVEQVKPNDLPELQLQPGRPLNPQQEREDIVTLQTFYAERGNAEVQIAPRIDVNAGRNSANVTYVVTEGPQIKVDSVIVRGNTYTDQDVVLRKSELRSGEPFSYGSILEAQRNLYRLGIFQRVDIQPEQAGTGVGDRNVTIQVEEGKNLTVSGSIGLRAATAKSQDSNISPRVAAAVAHRNLFGSGRYLGLEVIASKEEQEGILTYREPFIASYNIPVQFSIFQLDDRSTKERQLRQSGMSIEASKIAFSRTRWSMQYQYKISKCVEGDLCKYAGTVIIPELDRSQLDIQISSVTGTFFWDTRDDIVDPHRGFFTSASLEYAFPTFSATANFTKEFLQGAWYIPVSERSVFAISGRAGLIQAKGTETFITPAGEELRRRKLIPLSERFTAGGENSHRAYPLDLLGTLCADLGVVHENDPTCSPTLTDLDDRPGKYRLAPLGGSGIFILNAEYRFPVFSSVGGAVFADAGDVFGKGTIRFDELRYGVGAGIRYISPVGPIRIDIGWPLEKRSYDRTFAYSITLGYAF